MQGQEELSREHLGSGNVDFLVYQEGLLLNY